MYLQLAEESWRLIFSYQEGIYGSLRPFFAEKWVTIPRGAGSSPSRYHDLPSTFRPLKSAPEGFLDMHRLYFNHNHRDRRFPLHLAIAEGDIETVKRILECVPELLTPKALHCSLLHHRSDIVYYIVPLLMSSHKLDKPLLSYVYNSLDYDILEKAVETEDVALVQYLYRLGARRCRLCLSLSARSGNMRLVEFLIEHNLTRKILFSMELAVSNGHFEVLKLLLNAFPEKATKRSKRGTEGLFGYAARAGNIAIIEYLLQHMETLGLQLPDKCKLDLFRGGLKHVHVLQYVHSKYGIQGSLEKFWTTIIENGNDKVLSWFIQMYGWNRDVVETCGLYVSDGYWFPHFDSKMPCAILDKSVPVENVAIVEILHAIGHPLNMVHPASIEVAEFMHRVGFQFKGPSVVSTAIRRITYDRSSGNFKYLQPNFELVKFYHQECPLVVFTAKHMEDAAELGAIDIVRYLNVNTFAGCTQEALKSASIAGHLDVVQYMVEHQLHDGIRSLLNASVNARQYHVAEFLLTKFPHQMWEPLTLTVTIQPELFDLLLLKYPDVNDNIMLTNEAILYGQEDVLRKLFRRGNLSSEAIMTAIIAVIEYGSSNIFLCLWNFGVTLGWTSEQRIKFVETCLSKISEGPEFVGNWLTTVQFLQDVAHEYKD